MRKIWKRFAFDLDVVKKIEDGMEGRIVTIDGNPVRILATDILSAYSVAYAEKNESTGKESVGLCTPNGVSCTGSFCLYIELPVDD